MVEWSGRNLDAAERPPTICSRASRCHDGYDRLGWLRSPGDIAAADATEGITVIRDHPETTIPEFETVFKSSSTGSKLRRTPRPAEPVGPAAAQPRRVLAASRASRLRRGASLTPLRSRRPYPQVGAENGLSLQGILSKRRVETFGEGAPRRSQVG